MFTHDKFVEGQSVDLSDVLIETTPVITPFSTFLLGKNSQALAPSVSWLEEALNADTAVTLAEGGDAPAGGDDNTAIRQNYLEIFADAATVSNTAQASTAKGIADLLAHQVANRTQAIKLRIEDKLINGTKGYNSSTKTYTTDGILAQIHADNKISTDAFSEDVFNQALAKLYDAGVNYNMTVFLPAILKQQINQFDTVQYMARDNFIGFDTELYTSVYGQVHFVLDEKLGANKLFVVNGDYLELPTLIPFHGVQQPASGSKQSIFLETQCGLKLLNQKAAASIEINDQTTSQA
jgi:hypothetical protein